MALGLDDKKVVVEEIAAIAANAYSAVVAEYRGLTVSELTELRKSARESGVYLRVVKNSLAKRAVKGTEFECMKDGLSGPLIIAFSMEDLGSAARIFSNFSKENDKLITKLVVIGGQLYDASELQYLASMPTRDQAISLLMALMKAPVEKFVRTLAEPHAKLAGTITAVKEQKEAA